MLWVGGDGGAVGGLGAGKVSALLQGAQVPTERIGYAYSCS